MSVNEADPDEEEAGNAGNDADGGRTEEDTGDLVISDIHRQRAPASDTGAPSDTTGAGTSSADPPSA